MTTIDRDNKDPDEMTFWENIFQLFRQEFGFNRYHEYTGHKLIHKNKDNTLYKPNRYRGISLYLKEVIESILALVLIIYFIYILIHLTSVFFDHVPFELCNTNPYINLIKEALTFTGTVLIIDSILLIAALIGSPGIDETIDSISISVAGVFILVLGQIQIEKIINNGSTIILQVLLPLAAIVVILIITKHFLKWLNDYEKYLEKNINNREQ